MATKANNDSLEEQLGIQLIGAQQTPYKSFKVIHQATEHHFYISQAIGDPDGYIDMIYEITNAAEEDVVYIHLNTIGGQLDTGVQIINAIQNSGATVVTILEGVAHSLGTLIFLAGDERVVNDHCMMMFHNFSAGVAGKGNEMVSELTATVKWFEALANDFYVPFLTPDEVARLVRGEDFWMQSEEIKKRLEVEQLTLLQASGALNNGEVSDPSQN